VAVVSFRERISAHSLPTWVPGYSLPRENCSPCSQPLALPGSLVYFRLVAGVRDRDRAMAP
jgi:hypothetical protein